MASVSMVTPSAFASLMVSCESVRSKASGRMMKSWPIFSSGVSASAGAGDTATAETAADTDVVAQYPVGGENDYADSLPD